MGERENLRESSGGRESSYRIGEREIVGSMRGSGRGRGREIGDGREESGGIRVCVSMKERE